MNPFGCIVQLCNFENPPFENFLSENYHDRANHRYVLPEVICYMNGSNILPVGLHGRLHEWTSREAPQARVSVTMQGIPGHN
jgi:hypothetical protein